MSKEKIKAVAEFLFDNFEFKSVEKLHPLWQSRWEGVAKCLLEEVIEPFEGRKQGFGEYFAREKRSDSDWITRVA